MTDTVSADADPVSDYVGPRTVSTGIEPYARAFPEHAHVTGISCIKRAVAIAKAGDKGTARLARSGGSHSVGLRAPRGYVQPAIDVAHFEHPIAQNKVRP